MATLGNIIWFIISGWYTALAWLLAGVIMACTVIGIPFAVAAFRFAGFAAFPFGRELIDARDVGENRITGTGAANIIWFCTGGWLLMLSHFIAAIACLVSCVLILPIILGAPAWAVAHARLAKVAIAPLGKRIISKADAQAARIVKQLKPTRVLEL